MALTYKQVMHGFNRSIDGAHLPADKRTEMIKKESQMINWDCIPDEIGLIDYEYFYNVKKNDT